MLIVAAAAAGGWSCSASNKADAESSRGIFDNRTRNLRGIYMAKYMYPPSALLYRTMC